MNKKKFAELLAALISSHGMTPEELAEESGLSLKAILEACRMSGFKIEDIEYVE